MVPYGQYHFFEWIYEVGQETGLKLVHQNSRIVPFDKTPTQSSGNLKKVNSAPHKLQGEWVKAFSDDFWEWVDKRYLWLFSSCQTIPEITAPEVRTHSPQSFWSGELDESWLKLEKTRPAFSSLCLIVLIGKHRLNVSSHPRHWSSFLCLRAI